jgi:hypothetical protein
MLGAPSKASVYSLLNITNSSIAYSHARAGSMNLASRFVRVSKLLEIFNKLVSRIPNLEYRVAALPL